MAGLVAELGGENSERVLCRADADHADVGRPSHARQRDQCCRDGCDPAEKPHCVFSSEVPHVPIIPVSRLRTLHTLAALSNANFGIARTRLYAGTAVFELELPERAGSDMTENSNPPH